MLINAMGLILADHDRVVLSELSQPRALAAMPFGGRYRIIDFALSNMVNSGIKRVGVIAMKKYRSLMDHLGTGSSWDLDRMEKGLSILPPYLSSSYFNSERNDLNGLLDFVKSAKERFVVVCDSNVIMNVELDKLVEAHQENDADMTVMYNLDSNKFGSPTFSLVLERGVLKDLLVDAPEPPTQRNSLGVMVMERQFLIGLLEEGIARGRTEFTMEILLKMYNRFKIRGFDYKGTALRINSVATYFSSSMRLLDDDIRRELYNTERPVYTKVKDEAPALYHDGNEVSNSLISDGCDITGTVKDSILFRGVHVGRHAELHNCIIMQDSQIGDGAVLNNVIIDKNTIIRPGVRLQGQTDYPVVIGKGVIV